MDEMVEHKTLIQLVAERVAEKEAEKRAEEETKRMKMKQEIDRQIGNVSQSAAAGHQAKEEDTKKPFKISDLKARKRKRSDSSAENGKQPDSNDAMDLDDDANTEPEAEASTSFRKKPPRSKTKAIYKSYEHVDMSKRIPEWYGDIDTRKTLARSDLEQMKALKEIIKRCIKHKDDDMASTTFADLRERVHNMEFYAFLTPGCNDLGLAPYLIKKAKVLEDEGLSVIFDSPYQGVFPWDIRANAEALWSRWMIGNFDPSILRGIDITKAVLEKSGKKRTAHKLTPHYCFKVSSNVSGANGLINGQWWPSRLCALRDGAHGEVEAGIHGQVGMGAFAVCISQGTYDDKDNGEVVEYCGTEGKDGVPSRGTQYLQEAFRKGASLRVLRAPKKGSKYAPKAGIRYDGLYKITDSEILNPKQVMIRFTLKRNEGQDPIRYKGEGIRPTNRELVELQKIKKYLA